MRNDDEISNLCLTLSSYLSSQSLVNVDQQSTRVVSLLSERIFLTAIAVPLDML